MKKIVSWLKKTAKSSSLKRPVKRYVQFGLWFGVVAAGVLVLGVMLFFSLLAIGVAVAGDAIWVFKSTFIIATTVISAGILIGSLYLVAELMQNRKHTLARWTRQSLRSLALLTVLPLILTISVVLATGDATNSSKQEANGSPSWAQDAVDANTYWTPQDSIANGSSQQTQQGGVRQQPTNQSNQTCTRGEIPYKTTYQHVSHLQAGQTQEVGGHNGSWLDCGNGKPIIISPVDKIVYVGAGLTDEEKQQQQIAEQQEYESRLHQWNMAYSKAYQSCMSSVPQNGSNPAGYSSWASFCQSQAYSMVGSAPTHP